MAATVTASSRPAGRSWVGAMVLGHDGAGRLRPPAVRPERAVAVRENDGPHAARVPGRRQGARRGRVLGGRRLHRRARLRGVLAPVPQHLPRARRVALLGDAGPGEQLDHDRQPRAAAGPADQEGRLGARRPYCKARRAWVRAANVPCSTPSARYSVQTGRVAVDVNPLRRRPPGPRVLVYLDQSTLSALVSEERFVEVREQLLSAVYEGRL